MSEPKLISPMLDNFAMGGPISDHDGVRCCPAMRNDSSERYIVKIISVHTLQSSVCSAVRRSDHINKLIRTFTAVPKHNCTADKCLIHKLTSRIIVKTKLNRFVNYLSSKSKNISRATT